MADASLTPASPLRESQVQNAVAFLAHPKVHRVFFADSALLVTLISHNQTIAFQSSFTLCAFSYITFKHAHRMVFMSCPGVCFLRDVQPSGAFPKPCTNYL